MRITITDSVQQEREVDVTFPVYRQHDVTGDTGPSSVIYMRVDWHRGAMREVRVQLTGIQDAAIAIREPYQFDASGSDYLLGTGLYASSATRFQHALAKAEDLLDTILDTIKETE